MKYQMEPTLEEIDNFGPRFRRLAVEAGFSPEDSLLLELAIVEALTNIVEHGAIPLGKWVVIDISVNERLLDICIEDEGSPIPPSVLDRAGPDFFAGGWDDPMCLPESGMGLSMIKTIMDRVEYAPGCPNVLRMSRQRMSAEQ